MEGLGAAASVIAVVELAGKVGTTLFQYLTAVKNARPEIERLRDESEKLCATLLAAQKLLDSSNGVHLKTSQGLRQNLRECHLELESLESRLRRKLDSGSSNRMRRLGLRSLKWPLESKEVDRIIASFERQRDSISTALTIDQVEQVLDISHSIVLSKLPIVDDALFDAHANENDAFCHPETRVDLLQEIFDWIDNPTGKTVFWLQGMAGTGKSTISRTVAQTCKEKGDLVATFFFKRGAGDRSNASRVITTIVSQLIEREPALAASVKAAIDSHPGITTKSMGDQVEELILKPLRTLKTEPGKLRKVVLVIDALDECGQEEDIKKLTYQISRGAELESIQWRAFMTGRPEMPVRIGFDVIRGKVERKVLDLLPETTTRRDLAVFFDAEFTKIRDEFNNICSKDSRLAQEWPDHTVIQELVHMAVPLFIFAVTVCRFVGDRAWADPRTQLEKILLHRANAQESEFNTLGATYTPILDQLIVTPRAAQERLQNEFRQVVGSIVSLAEPLSAHSLSCLLKIPRAMVDRRLMSLHSVLRVPDSSDSPIKTLHLSFRDFLVDPDQQESNPFWVDETAVHTNLALRCLDLLSSEKNLKQDICSLSSPGMSRGEIPITVIKSCLPADIRYACLYWVRHMKGSGIELTDDHPVYTFLTQHLLHWLEALALLGRVYDSVAMIEVLQDLVAPTSSAKISAFLYDAFRFVLSFRSIIEQSPLQVYSSALIFTPQRSLVKQAFQRYMPQRIKHVPGTGSPDWTDLLEELEIEGDFACMLEFSPDGRTIALLNDAGIHLWDAISRESKFKINPGCPVTNFKFSPGSKIILAVYGEGPSTMSCWDTETGEELGKIETEADLDFASVAFSPDQERVAVAKFNEISLWNISTCHKERTFIAPDLVYSDIVFSPNGQKVIIAPESRESAEESDEESDDRISKVIPRASILDIVTGEINPLECGPIQPNPSLPIGTGSILALSPDGATAAWQYNGTILIQDTMANIARQELVNFNLLMLRRVEFSPNGKLLACIYRKSMYQLKGSIVSIWDTTTGEKIHEKDYETSLDAVALSPNNLVFVLASTRNLRIFQQRAGGIRQAGYTMCSDNGITSDNLAHIVEEEDSYTPTHTGWVGTVAFSPDGRTIASTAYNDNRIFLWDSKTGQKIQALNNPGPVQRGIFWIDSTSVVCRSGKTTVIIWDTTSAEAKQQFHHDQNVNSIILSPNCLTLAIAFEDNIQLLDIVRSQTAKELRNDDKFERPTFSPDSKILATISYFTLNLWDVETGHKRQKLDLQNLEGHRMLSGSIAFSTNGKTLAAALTSNFQVIKNTGVLVWPFETGCEYKIFEPDLISRRSFHAIALSADGKIVAANGVNERTVNIWDNTRRRELQASSNIQKMSFSTDEQYLETNRGIISLKDREPYTRTFLATDWLWQDGRKTFFFPPGHRDFVSTFHANTFVLGLKDGGILFIWLDSNSPLG